MGDPVKVEVEIPYKEYQALLFLARHSLNWCGNDYELKAIEAVTNQAIRLYIEGERNSGYPDACMYLAEELKVILD